MRFIFLIIIGFLLYQFWPTVEENLGSSLGDSIKKGFHTVKDHTNLKELNENLTELESVLIPSPKPDGQQNLEDVEVDKPVLEEPTHQTFSISNIEIGDNKNEVEQQVGSPTRITLNEYGTKWFTYHQNYRNFLMISYNQEDQVAGIYTNQDLITSSNGIAHGTSKELVLQNLGEPIDKLQKGNVFYQLQDDRDYDLFLMDDSYVYIFYDKHQNNTVTAMQIISEQMEQKRVDFYTKESEGLKEGFEYQMFDLTNATRREHGLPILEWDERVKKTARNHSLDMAENNYFSHTNLAGQSPFDRMLEDDILFTVAGENLAYGQTSSIFAHEGLMNSLGHRENILKPEFRQLGVGVAFNATAQPYYTQKYYTKKM